VVEVGLPESWAGVAEPLRAPLADVERVSDAIRATLRARIAEARATQTQGTQR